MARRADREAAERESADCESADRGDGDAGGASEPGALAAAVLGRGLAVVDGYASPARVRELIACAAGRRERGDFREARTGTSARGAAPDRAIHGARMHGARMHGARMHGARLRGDHTCWLEEPLFAAERALLADLEVLRLMLNCEGMLGVFELEAHYAEYPPGTGYARHVDQLQGRDQRVVSLVLYLNENWQPRAGGELRLFDADGADGYRDVEPVAGRLVCFMTAAREHAVLPTREPRLSISGWFRRRD